MSTLHIMFDQKGTQLQTPLHRMRRQQLHYLAKAFDIAVENGGTTKDILVTLLAAESEGAFKLPPKHPEFYEKAMMDSDQTADRKFPGRNNYGA